MINILIVEDEEIQRINLYKMIMELGEEIKIFGAEDELTALEIASKYDIDFFYIDISLKNSSGMDLGLKLRDMQQYTFSIIVFITSHKNHIMTALNEVHCYSYIIKPYKKEEIKSRTMKLINDINKREVLNEKERKYVIFECNKVNVKIYIEDIFFIEVRLRNLMVHTINGLFEFNRLSLKKVIDMISDEYIIQTHKSYIINTKNILKIEKETTSIWKVSFVDYNEVAYISSKYKNEVDKRFG